MNLFAFLNTLLLFGGPLLQVRELQEPPPVFDEWAFVGHKSHWIFHKGPGLVPAGSPSCPGGDMIEIGGQIVTATESGEFNQSINYDQDRTCTKWLRKKWPEACNIYNQRKWAKIREQYSRKNMNFCIDPFEWPNQIGAAPWIMVSWFEAKNLCEARGKRLCTEEEWTFACEGNDALPYPYGYVRDTQACNIDKKWIEFDESKLLPRGIDQSGEELDRLWQGESSGTRSQCVSPFGVYDMTGNVEEWTVASRSSKFQSVLKGGYWGPVKNTCRSSIRVHGPEFMLYQQGFRCCADVKR